MPLQKQTIKRLIAALLLCITSTTYAKTFSETKNLLTIKPHVKLWTEIHGKGMPVVILMNGGGDTIQTEWTRVIPAISKLTTVLAYDRVGEIKSPPLSNLKPRTASGIVTRLRLLLKTLHLKPPYVLVAHSIGGLYAQYYARHYPKEIAAIVTIDGNLIKQQYPEMINGVSKKTISTINEENKAHRKKLNTELKSTLKSITTTPTPAQAAQIEYSLEVMGKEESARQVMASPPPSKQLIIAALSAGTYALENNIQKQFAYQVPNHIFAVFPQCGHYIQNCEPGKVNAIIKKVILMVRQKKQP